MENSQLPKLSHIEANEILEKAYRLLQQEPCLRLGQAIYTCSWINEPWPELFYEEDPVKASELFYSLVENGGKRKLTGSLDTSFLK